MTAWMFTSLVLSAVLLAWVRGQSSGGDADKIFNGTTTGKNAYRWTAWIKKNGSYVCGASLIDQNWVLTAASCVEDYVANADGQYYRVLLGDYKLGVDEEEQQIRSCNIFINRKYNATTSANNIAMMQLDRPANLNRGNILVVPKVAAQNINIKTLKQSTCVLTGFGDSGNGSLNAVRQSLEVRFRNPSRCAGLPNFDSGQHFCYSVDNGAPCNFDAGSPVTCNIDNVWTQVGVQLTETCSPGFHYGTWTYKNRRFISETLSTNSTEACKPVQSAPDYGCGPAGKSFMVSYVKPDPDNSRPALYITSSKDTTVYLQPGDDVKVYFNRFDYPVTASNGLVLTLPTELANHANNGISSKSLRIYSPDDLFVMMGYEPDAIGTTQVFPEECLQNFAYDYLPLGFAAGFAGLSEVVIVAIENNTDVQISGPANAAFTLNQFQLYRVNVDGSGMTVVSSGPLSIFSGVACGNVPDTSVNYCDTMLEQIPPSATLQEVFIVPSLRPRTGLYLRVLATMANTNLTFQEFPSLLITAYDNRQLLQVDKWEAAATTTAAVVYGTAPIVVGQYGYGGEKDSLDLGDPSFLIVPAIAEYTSYYRLYGPSTLGYNYVAIIISNSSDASGVHLNGVPVTGSIAIETVDVIGKGTYIIYYEELCYGVNTLKHVDEITKFGVVQYNLEFYRETVSAPRRLY